MSNREKYDAAFMEVFEINRDSLNSSLEYQSITAWDSVGHMALVILLILGLTLNMHLFWNKGLVGSIIQAEGLVEIP